MNDLKKQIEAILFSIGKYISTEEIAGICKKDPKHIKEALLGLTVDYENDDKTSLVVINDGDSWKLTTREEYSHLVKNVISETELTKSQMETLAVIAFKYPIKQADLIRIRTNKAYDHLTELEGAGFISRQKYGRTRLIKLTDKFFEYFDLPREKLKDRFKGFGDLANTIEKKEEEIDQIKKEQKKAAEIAKEESEEEKKLANGELEIDLIDDKGKEHKLEVVDEPVEKPEIKEIEEKIGELEIVDEEIELPEPEIKNEEEQETETNKEEMTEEDEILDFIDGKSEEEINNEEKTTETKEAPEKDVKEPSEETKKE